MLEFIYADTEVYIGCNEVYAKLYSRLHCDTEVFVDRYGHLYRVILMFYKIDTEGYTEIHRSLYILNLKFLQSNDKRDIVYMGWY